MLFCSERKPATSWTCPIDHADMFMRLVDPMNVEKSWGDEGARSGTRGRRPVAQQFNLEAALLARFTQRRLLGILIQFDVAPEGKPLAEFSMVHQEDLCIIDNEDCDSEIDLLVNVRHEGSAKSRKRSILAAHE